MTDTAFFLETTKHHPRLSWSKCNQRSVKTGTNQAPQRRGRSSMMKMNSAVQWDTWPMWRTPRWCILTVPKWWDRRWPDPVTARGPPRGRRWTRTRIPTPWPRLTLTEGGTNWCPRQGSSPDWLVLPQLVPWKDVRTYIECKLIPQIYSITVRPISISQLLQIWHQAINI